MVTISNRTVTWVYLSGSCNQITVQPRRLLSERIRGFERFANVEILEFFHIVICQTEEGPMKVKKSYGSMFLDDKTEMAGVVTKPNE